MLATAMQSIGTNYLRRSLGLENEKHGQKEYYQVQYWTNSTRRGNISEDFNSSAPPGIVHVNELTND